ncbi:MULTISPECIES: 2-polyprenyl-3-methyl-6-methoxy-1,4-benzoquinone monooxygenase [Paraburkholderia]|jgi:ubiquinone biosynthesis monooxygenase Coq7|uniref:3-demethoxyubiquinol 3-hydroxylase n=1 Tax=Paraburkholderia aspalathi TaxID=1324617 RepID=A0A1I7ENM0_9BURK|nr:MULTISPECIES: 2-polyprenyl-3-methyl-6-methoxy-1,4-benzoquinone monooxygenase [Paraburkholderia]MBK3820454.1 2-polyprenyl-3-methyl-6-methoxy-1,4-benzoquinone monooxygenase [Paraburkholderia aspalathi]MBK3832306.1 2-polyprenyl-3-methyl-6-methoxy-1,4-benzoquinone monooxygenase [Paraburkholderia aspalathi]MBK3842507.1 2-polyprenyl-3-methyl-6-methoxy-1,4-benzoquinone monooxygenase [Paraburkholderia aspalathi]MBK3862013.1 2-polyprenyl-3-methyl-6-methoxy-1,4-benzoquinone monooxygenase [Paraburkhold
MFLDELISEFDRGLRSMTGVSRMSRPLPVPQESAAEPAELSPEERAHAAGLMRVNHVGEVCAQALYQAQKLATRSPSLRAVFNHAAIEEEDHLAWTAKRLEALDSRPSLLNPLWYTGALAIGLAAGRMGDRVSLGFMAETERQVEQHLDSHLDQLPAADRESRAIVEQMRVDEAEHGKSAMDAGGVELPFPARALMRAVSKVMTRTAYYL